MVEQADHTADGSSSSRVDPGPLVNRIDALYYSAATLSTVGYGDFTRHRAQHACSDMALGTAMLMLLGVFPLIVGAHQRLLVDSLVVEQGAICLERHHVVI